MNPIIFVQHKENNGMNNDRMNIGRILAATLMSACLVLISLAASGCIMQTETYDDFDAPPVNTEESPYLDDEIDMGHVEVYDVEVYDVEVYDVEMEDEADVPTVVVEELVIEAKPAPRALLDVGLDHFAATFTVIDQYFEVVIEDAPVSDCPVNPSNYYNICSLDLPVGTYIVKFSSVDGYESPDDVIIDLTEAGTATYGSYAEEAIVAE